MDRLIDGPPDRPQVREDLTVVELDGEAVIYDEITTDIHHLNPTATILFSLLDGTATVKELAFDVSAAFGLSEAQAAKEIAALVGELADSALLVGYEPDPAEGEPGSDREPIGRG